MAESLDQIELADRLGFDYVWAVEHHFLEEYSHSSAPEVFLGAASQRTRRIRLGHGIVQLPPAFNHPVRVAERIATLDLISGGRVEFGTGQGSSQAELGGFRVDRALKHEQWKESLEAVVAMMVEKPFAGYQGRFVSVPPRNIVPKPKQKPHPPLWMACSRRETIVQAAELGMGALSFSFIEPEKAKEWVDGYYAALEGARCVPAGHAVNANIAVVLPLMCHREEQTALDRGLDGAHFFFSRWPIITPLGRTSRVTAMCGASSPKNAEITDSLAKLCRRTTRRRHPAYSRKGSDRFAALSAHRSRLAI